MNTYLGLRTVVNTMNLFVFQVMSGSVSFDNLSSLMRTSESFSDLNAELNPLRGRGASSNMASSRGASGLSNEEGSVTNNKPFGLGK